MSKIRAERALRDGILIGAPELVVEVRSPSNRGPKLDRYRQLCIENGTSLFLVLDPVNNNVAAYVEGDRVPTVYRVGEVLIIRLFGVDASIPVTRIFEGITLPGQK